MQNKFIVIMAGGIGSRFWPSSTKENPKQFLDILGIGKSLIRMTFERCLLLVPAENILILTNKKYKDLVLEHLPELPARNILCEPTMNNTAPAVAYAALRIQAMNPDATFAVLPSDHVIVREQEYVRIMNVAFEEATSKAVLMTLGIEPIRPDTGYGYIQYDKSQASEAICKVLSFREKPDLHTAQAYISTGQYLWNAGMFVWSVSSVLAAFKLYANDVLTVLIQEAGHYNTDGEQAYIDRVYPLTPNISIDYAILERANNVFTIPADIGWSDLGTWNSLHAYLSHQSDQVKIGEHIHLTDCKNIIVMSNNDKTVVIKGLKDYIVVDEDNALLVYPKSDEQEIKEVVKDLNKI